MRGRNCSSAGTLSHVSRGRVLSQGRVRQLPLPWVGARGAIALAAVILLLLRVGFDVEVIPPMLAHIAKVSLLGLYGFLLILDYRAVARATPAQLGSFKSVMRPELVVVGCGIALGVFWPIVAAAVTILALIVLTRLYLRLVQLRVPAGLIFVGSFVALIALGVGLLKLPAATPSDQPISLLDATFTITSAISQTGLVVRDTGEGFTRFGQVVILVWIQVGALGIVVFGALIAALVGSSFGLKATQTIAEGTEQGWSGQLSLQKLVTFIIVFTHLIEIVGAVVLYFTLPSSFPGQPSDFETVGDRIFHSVFFSVSSFCNAGFATTENSLAGLRAHAVPHAVIVPLIVLGSIGFPVLANVGRVLWAKCRGVRTESDASGALIRLSLNTKIVLMTSLLLYVIGFALICIAEAAQTDQPLKLILLDAHFMNVNRTSGFNTIETSEMGLLSRLVLIFLMFVGGAPGSVAGGIKLMVFAVLTLTVISTLRGQRETTAFGRTIPDELVRKSAALVVLSLVGVMTTTGVLALTERLPAGGTVPLDVLLFEATSAFGTTGLSLGITGDLSEAGKVAVTIAMFVGRVGVFALLAALVTGTARRRPRVAYPTESVVVY